MSEENSELTQSWVFIDSAKKLSENESASGVEEVAENNSESHVDSDTDSISIISESGCSYKTDEEEFAPTPSLETEEPIGNVENLEIKPPEVEVVDSVKPDSFTDKRNVEKRFYFMTSAACAVLLIVISVAIQQYFYGSSDVNNINNDFGKQSDFSTISQYVQNVKSQSKSYAHKSYGLKRKAKPSIEKSTKLQSNNNFHDKSVSANIQAENNELKVETDVKSNYKLHKNKIAPMKHRENCDVTNKCKENDEHNLVKPVNINNVKKIVKREKEILEEDGQVHDENYVSKLKQLKIKEDYLKEKEKFLIEKEHDLLKKEIKLNKGKSNNGKNKFDKKPHWRKEKEHQHNSGKKEKEHRHNCDKKEKEHKRNSGKEDKLKLQKKYSAENTNSKNYKKYKNKEEKKYHYIQSKHKVNNEQHKKRNISGQWYIDMHTARNHVRQKEHASDWVFDRAHLRSMKRNKAHWYFQWMVDRARLRVK